MALGVGEAYIDYWMGHKGSTYHDIQMKGVEFLRKLYANAGFSSRTQARNGKVDLFKQMARPVGASSTEIKEALEALAEPHRIYATPEYEDNYGLPAVLKALKESILTELQGSLVFPGPPLVHRQSGGPGEI